MPFFSIICVSYNDEENIAHTINSVLEQSFDDYEVIVKDACSKDNTVKNIPQSDKIKIYVTPDKGIYYGMNEAVSYANGEYLLFLNCGDTLTDKTVLQRVYNTAKNMENTNAIVYGDYVRKGVYKKQPSKITEFYLYRTTMCHQTMFFGKEIFSKWFYNTEFKIAADYDLTVKSLKNDVNFVYIDGAICTYLGDGFSENEKNKKLLKEEQNKIISKYYSGKKIFLYRLKIFMSFRALRKKISSDKSPLFLRKAYIYIVNILNR